jgi:hypothetical protein
MTVHLTCATAGPLVVATTFAGRGYFGGLA